LVMRRKQEKEGEYQKASNTKIKYKSIIEIE
jgi:hypothetical protein